MNIYYIKDVNVCDKIGIRNP